MLRSILLASLLLGGAPAAAQDVGGPGMDFMLRPTQDASVDPTAPEEDDIWTGAANPPPEVTGAVGLPLAGPTGEEPVGAPLAGPGPQAAAPARPAAPRRPSSRLDEQPDPFAATGVHLGTFVIRPAIEIGVEATDNAAGGRAGESAVGFVFAPELTVRGEGSRHELSFDAGGEAIFYGDNELDERAGEARLFGRYALTSRTDIQAALGYRFGLERYTDPDTPAAAAERPAVHRLNASLGATQRFGRTSLGVSGTVDRNTHEDVDLAGGGTAERDELDNTAYGVRARAAYEASGAATPYVEAAAGRREFDRERDDAGFERSSLWGELRGGLFFDFGSKLSGEVALGYRVENPEDDRLEDLNGLTALASVLWSPRRLTEVRFDLSTETEPSGLPDVSGSLLYSGSVTVTRQLSSRLRLEAGLGLTHERFVGADRRDLIFNGFAGASYAFNRAASLQARYTYENTNSNDDAVDSDENRVGIRLRLQR